MGELVRLTWPLHAHHVCQRLWHFLREDFSTDFELSIKDNEEDWVDQPSFRVHRLIISAVCPLFKQYLGDKILFSNRQHVGFQEVNSLVEFIYRGKTTVSQERLPHLRHLADSMGLTVLVESIDGLLGSSAERDTTSTAKETELSSSNSMAEEGHIVSDNAANTRQISTSRTNKNKIRSKKGPMRWAMTRRDRFKCQHCSRSCDSQKDLDNHIDAVHHLDSQGNMLDKTLKCPKCAFTCYAMFHLSKHRSEKHRDRTPLLKCNKCQFLCSNDTQLSRHLETLHAHESLLSHMPVINLAEDSTCDDVVAEDNCSISENVPNKLQKSTSRIKKCNKTCSKKRAVKCETRRIKERFRCQNCPRRFQSHRDLLRHVWSIHHLDSQGNDLEKTIKCPKCDFTCYAMFQLNKHARVKNHTGVHIVADADDCISENVLNTSESTTSKFKKCSKTCCNLKTRIKGSFRCQHCNRGFKCDEALFRHVAAIHHLGSQGRKMEKTVKCSKCDFTCHTRFQLKKHMRLNKHTRSHMVKCDNCDFVCRTEVLLSHHLETFHTDGIFKCSKCDHISHTRDELDQHVEQHKDNRSSCALEEIVSNDESSLKDSVTDDQGQSATERARNLFVAALTRSSNVAKITITLTNDSISSRADDENVDDENGAEKEVVKDAKNTNGEKDSDNGEFEGDEKSSSSQTRDYDMEEDSENVEEKDHEKMEDNNQDEEHLLRSGTSTFEEQTSNLEPISQANLVSSESADEERSTMKEIVNGNENGDSSEKDLSDATMSAQVEDGKITKIISTMDFYCKHCSYSCDFNFALNRLLSSVHYSDIQLNNSEANIKCPRCNYICYTMARVNNSESEVHISEASVLKCGECDYSCFSPNVLARHQNRRHPPKWIGDKWGADVKGLSALEVHSKRDKLYRCHVCSKTYKYKACIVMHMEKKHQQPFANVVPSTDIVASTAINEAMSVSQVPESAVTTFGVKNLATTMDNSEDGLMNDHDYCSKLSTISCSDSSIETGVDAAVELRESSAEFAEENPSSFYSVLTSEPLGDCLGIDSAEVADEAVPKEMEDKVVCPDRLQQSFSSSENVTAVKMIEETNNTTCEKIEEIFQCRHCSYNTSVDRRYLIMHVMSKHEMDIEGNKLERSVKCPNCEFSCVKQFQLRRHNLVVHGDQIKCDKCSHTCSSQAEMIRHQGTFHDNYKPFKCDTCGFSCATRNSLDQHSALHNSSKTSRFKRRKCGASLKGQVQLLNIRNGHGVGGDQYPCNRCHRTFGSRYNLESHEKKSHRTDNNKISAGPFKCDKCGHVSKNISSHDRHLKIFGHGRFVCEVCGVMVKHSITIERHVKDQHTAGSEPQVCHVCHTACDTKWDLRLHMNKEHGVELPNVTRYGSRKKDGPPFNCDKCDYTTPKYKLYRLHEKWHNEPKRICELCGKAMKGLLAMKRHLKLHENNALNK